LTNNNKQFILASKSPRRIELLKVLNIDFTVIPSDIFEEINENLTNEEIVMDLALQKAEDISSRNLDAYVLGFDTLVILDGVPLGKPADEEDAFRMLKLLSGRTHTVLTGCAIVSNIYRDSFYSSADVTFYDMSDLLLDAGGNSGLKIFSGHRPFFMDLSVFNNSINREVLE